MRKTTPFNHLFRFAFFDYIHLGKINGEWKIINILWAWN
ncbi:hypothetical protein A33Q_2398 [Indibacter alkaliphilus LW1]|uniref:Lumazine-binding n=1 Tax=Indibacter alkaliphilus (strain CCUG 57479 / KCTC 22604 / LW1) TaxID=1189612 RepID=S2E3B3_INDAL|nr:hypothetical protein A33Q_2398 [Indibacter alkaliphilus LW1]